MNDRLNEFAMIGRRGALKTLGAGGVALVGACLRPRGADAKPEDAVKLLQELSGGASAKVGRIAVDLPQVADDGAVVPISISVDSPMTATDYVKAIHVVAEENPNPEVVSFNLTPASGKAAVTTRMRLAKTQNVVVAAVMGDGSVYTAKKMVKVTIGGCG